MSLTYLNQYLEQISKAIDSGQATRVKPLLRVDNPVLQQALFAAHNGIPAAQLQGACSRWLAQPWANIVAQHIQALAKRNSGRVDQAFDIYSAKDGGPAKHALEALQEAYSTAWIGAIAEQATSNAVMLARETDAQLMLDGDSSKTKVIGGLLQLWMHQLGPARQADETARRRCHLSLLILLARIHMRLNNVSGCSQLLKLFKQLYTPNDLQAVPAAYRVTAFYYLGRTELNSDNVAGGLDLLDRAYRDCKADSENVKHILRVLVPLKMLHGDLPIPELLERHGLQEYVAFRQAVQTGDVGLFERSMEENQLRLIANGSYLLLEKLRFNVYRRLLQRCVQISRTFPGREWQPHHLPLDLVLGVLQQQGVDTDMDELECMLSNCIVRKYMKGYISNKQKIAVLSKDGAFPPPTDDWWREPHFVSSA